MVEKKIVNDNTDKKNEKLSKNNESIAEQGLCINCENRFVCTLEKPAGGVWWCEYYR